MLARLTYQCDETGKEQQAVFQVERLGNGANVTWAFDPPVREEDASDPTGLFGAFMQAVGIWTDQNPPVTPAEFVEVSPIVVPEEKKLIL